MTRLGTWATFLVLLAASSASAANLALLKAYPNPVRPSQGDTGITFDDVAGARIEIYNAQGRLVREIAVPDASTQFFWDLKNDSGKEVASGIYLYIAFSGSDKRVGKVGIIR